jgi:hypothetical protein
LAISCCAFGQVYTINTFAGGGLPANIAGTSASLLPPGSVAADGAGNLFLADEYVVLRWDATSGVLTLVAGNGTRGYSGDNGPAASAQLNSPTGVAVDAAGSVVYIADTGNHCIRKVSNGFITTVAGNGTPGYSGDNGPAASAQLKYPKGVAVDSAGNLYIADTSNQRIRMVLNGTITTVAGNGTEGFSGDNGLATGAQLNSPGSIAVDSAFNLYIADTYNQRIREVLSNGAIIATVAGNGTAGYSGEGPATTVQLNYPEGVAVDAAGNLYIADTNNNRIRKVSNGAMTTVAGNGTAGYSGDGQATSAQLNYPGGVAVDAAGNLYVADTNNNRIREVSSGVITTVAGGGASFGDGGPATGAQLFNPYGVAVDAAGNLYIADSGNSRIRKVSNGIVTTVAGNGTQGFSGDNGAATSAQLSNPYGVAVDSAGNLYVADSGNSRIRKVTNGTIATVAGNGTQGFSGDNGVATSAQLNNPFGVAVDSIGNLYIADSGNSRIRMVSNGVITTVAGNGAYGYSGDGGLATSAQLGGPDGVAVDSAGDLYIADTGASRLRMVSNGVITTVAGNGTQGFSGDGGPATSAQFKDLTGVAVDSAGNLYIGDTENNRIRKVSSGVITTVAGNGTPGFSGDNGLAASAEMDNPFGVAVDVAGAVYVADLFNDRIRVLTPSGAACTASVAPLVLSPPAWGGLVTVAITTGASCAWAIQSLPDWIVFSGSAVETGPGSVTLSVSANLGGPRMATISIAGASVTVNQAEATLPLAPVLSSPANGAIGISATPALNWNASTGATSYDIYFGTASAPPLVTHTASLSYSPSALNAGTTYYWAVAARNVIGATESGVWSFTTSCASPLNPSGAAVAAGGGSGSVPVTAATACGWTAVSTVPWIAIASGASSGYLTWITDEYSTMTPFNGDNSNILLVHQSYFGLYDGSGSYLRDLPLEINSSSQPRWSRSDNHTIYYIHGNQLKTYDISSGAMSILHTFGEYSAISGMGESDISLDGDHFVFAGDNEFIFVYQISKDTKFTVFDAGNRPFDSLYITPDNNVIVSWDTAGNVRYTGQELFDIKMTFLRQVGHADGHKDLTTDANGDEVLIWTNSGDPSPIPNCNNGIVKIRLADASQTCLLQLDWSLAVNVSGPDNSGFVYVDAYAPGNPTPSSGWAAYTNELLQVKLDGSQALRLAHHRSRPYGANTYNWQPRMSTSRDGSRVVYSSDYDLQVIDGYADEYSDVYLVMGSPPAGLAGVGVELPPEYDTFQPPAVGGAYVDPVFGSTITRVSNALGTPDASASANGTVGYTVAANTGAQRTGTIAIAGQTFTVTQAAAPILSVSKTHTGDFTQGQNGATYTVTVSNSVSAAPTSGAVTVTETPPSGLTLASMAGAGWTCPSGGTTCTRSDALAAGVGYPAITVTVNVATNAASPQVNAVSVSGGGSVGANTTDSTIITACSLPNLALGQAASQSSTYGSITGAANAVDGNTDGNYFDGSITHTNLDANAWWQVDLGASATVSSITIWNRTDCCGSRLGDYWVFVSDTPFGATDTPATLQSRAGTWSSHQTVAPNPSTTIAAGGAQGRYVRVQLSDTDYLSLAEVQVTGNFNLALGQAASQSSTYSSITGAANAVDGNTDGNYLDGSMAVTNPEANAWWQVDLGAGATVSSIAIWNRTDCCGDRLGDYWVFVSDTPFAATDTPATLQSRAGTWNSHQTVAPNPSTTIAAGGAQGRYVRVQLSDANYLTLAEVQVMGSWVSTGTSNLALGKAALQSSTYSSITGAANAVDGNTDGNYLDGSMAVTNPEANAWWQVDLGAGATVSSIAIWNRTDCCGDRLGDYWVFVSDTPFAATDTPATLQSRAGTWNSHQTVAPNPSTTIAAGGAQGRYVRVQLSGTDYLSLAEVQVMGTSP